MVFSSQRLMAGSLAPISWDTTGGDTTQNTSLFTDPQQLEKFVQDVVPLLFQVWAEVDPKNLEGMEG